MNWRHFTGAAILVSAVLWAMGAPPFAIGAGLACSLAFNLWKTRKS